ncbi:choice-of-anchor Q domain-containing protein [Limnoraphis robusta]|uniref:Choice-of-anchor Q domain-containing protein n=1 Tax=Limnoraphis robusta CCNP1315 TaxID=3110306 RepID=A0ABU5TYL6_9CYAN|nr:choice-of-anchor Q domain-containing protein [Limnoraphis robusta]MEA5499973.1 choice-of-anchor Q domain-containing protein [Limnoraphis robusta BA-68 BA1]MEA5520036.1 choice-of-anchor Q domain-containing protein [Limnoraphis robusta CCNP1315]MEA5548781.1 choice-of-anchor Q domain-containing protein [Limnoraphis robusta CCNP1324]
MSIIFVDTLVDENDGDLSVGDLSLREAIANASPGDVINFDSSLIGGTITLTEGQLNINKPLTINALGAENLTISGNNNSRVFLIDDSDNSTSIPVEINGLTISDGHLPRTLTSGAGILNYERLELFDVIVTNNQGGSRGTGIGNIGFLKISDSVVKENSNGLFRGAVGGAAGIANFSEATLEIERSTISNNSSGKNGGGIINSGGILEIRNSTISGNTIDAAEIGFGGAGIFNSLDGTLTISNSTVTNNEIVLNPDSNTSTFIAGGIQSNSGVVTVNNTIVAGNKTDAVSNDVEGSFNSNGNNLIGNLGGSTGFNSSEQLTVPIDSVIDPVLANNGGFTETHALVSGSPAIDAASSSELTDQRGVSRPFGSNPDIGAVEFSLLDTIPVPAESEIDQYLIGDWNGDGIDDLAIRDEFRVFMDYTRDGIPDIIQEYGRGNNEDEYLVGDWDGDGRDNLAVRRGNQVFMDTNFDGSYDVLQQYGTGNNEDEYLVGDWDGDGDDNLAVRRGNQVFMDTNFDGSHDVLQQYGRVNNEDEYLVGNWDGNGGDNLAVRRGFEAFMDTNFDGSHDFIRYFI